MMIILVSWLILRLSILNLGWSVGDIIGFLFIDIDWAALVLDPETQIVCVVETMLSMLSWV
jgi:hypothetical protein